ncbi:immunogenic protein [Lysinibacillus sphaericus]|uniref:TAXI family TRAP transporter solute-binding subunit n=1 Tax=Lysinibacillus sphaericus TaxID=1421 RepID=UPI0018CF6BD5|nr:TAXI family TRAP transporter solute-binding subunit [Lysinibacillus sphaericus]MBG9456861.1 immunogenic protein [Lysinibacillus sphaericus]MBG9480540.1 immunogenic protein [Lysinibacillus sphaericus]MBG9595167.1 immunogenic protein [Lysinibacillus sphaericus]
MKKKQFRLLMLLSAFALLILAACGSDSGAGSKDSDKDDSTASAKPKFLNLLTGGTQGTYYALGGTFADLISKETDIKTTAEVSQASAANMTALQDGKGEIAFVQSDIAFYATEGTKMFDGKKIDTIAALGALYPETVQLVTTEASGIKSYADLKGKKVSVGAPGSGTYANAEQLLEIHGLTMDDIKAQNLDFGESADGLQSGQIDAAFITAGTPTGAVEALNATTKINIIGMDAGKADELIAKYPYYAKDTVKAGTYGIAKDTETVSVLAMLAVKKDLPEDVVYSMTKAIYDNKDKISHPKGQFIKAETGLQGINIDVHPGAQKYFDESK